MQSPTITVTRELSVAFILLLFSTSLNAQIKIKERVEISPTNNVRQHTMTNSEMPNITLPPIDPSVTALGIGGGFLAGVDCSDPNADLVFVPRIGGTLGIALCQCDGSASGDTPDDILLVFGPDGNIRNIFPLKDLDSCFIQPSGGYVTFYDPCAAYYHNYTQYAVAGEEVCWFNPFWFDKAAYDHDTELNGHVDSTIYWYAPPRIIVPVKAWEPLRFRLLTYDGKMIKDVNCNQGGPLDSLSLIVTGNWTQFPRTLPPYGLGVLVFRARDYDTETHEDFATVFPMQWLAIDSSAIGGSPSSVGYSDPIILPDSGMYRIILTGAKPNVNGTLTFIDTASHILFSDIQSHIGDTILVGPYGEGTSFQVELNGSNPSTTETSYGNWNMAFENWIDYDFGDVAITVEYAAQPPNHLELWSTSSTVYYGDTVDVDVVPCGNDSLFSPLGPDDMYEFSVALMGETSQYGQLIYQGQGGDSFYGIPSVGRRGVGVKFAANGIEPDSTVNLTFDLTARYIGGGGVASSIGITPIKQTQTKALMKQSNNNPSQGIVRYKNNKVALNKDARNKTYKKAEAKKLQTISALKRPKKKKIGHPLAVNKSKKNAHKSLSQKTILASTAGIGTGIYYLETFWTWGEKKYTILLGETKYYQAKPDLTDKTGTKLIFKEMSETSGWTSGGQPAQFTVTAETPTDKLGVYYEFKDNDGKILAGDMIRLIGRYWTKDQTYEGPLNATSGERSGSILIVVKKPSKLGDAPQSAIDVIGNPYALDDSIITHAGMTGILPQYIKAMIRNETVGRFAPSYRYEPFTDLKKVQVKDIKGNYMFKSKTPYWINSTSDLGTPGIPTDHSNLYNALSKIDGYPGYQTVWDIYNADMNKKQSLYSLNVYGNIYGLAEQWTLYYNKGIADQYSSAQASDSANAKFIRWMRDTWSGGLKNIVAQTRIASSYGLLQLIYYYGVSDAEYPIDANHRPEDINLVYNSLYYGIMHFSNKLECAMYVPLDSNNWPNGLEVSYLLGLLRYNGSINYALDVIAYSQQYLPQQ